MSFTSPVFIFLFFPLVILGYYLIHPRLKNIFLLMASLAFYAWGEPKFIFIFIIAVLLNYAFGLLIERAKKRGSSAKFALVISLMINLGLLFYYKYLVFGAEIMNSVFDADFLVSEIALPLGISFFTFRSISYVADIYTGKTNAEKNPVNAALYISFFPQVSMGPITEANDFLPQLKERRFNIDVFADGIKRLIVGMAKKLIIADTLGIIVDPVFSSAADGRTVAAAWTGIIAYCLQLYFDFSGYSDMAIGLSKMFGFETPENFDYPYMADSITDFWRRWHMTLSRFFRDYVYIPLGGNRKGNVYVHIFVVFLLTGLWHGAAWNFVVWGLWHGLFRLIEMAYKRGGKELKIPSVLKHLYALAVVAIGWVLFRANDLSSGITYLGNLVGINSAGFADSYSLFTLKSSAGVLAVGILFCFPVAKKIRELLRKNKTLEFVFGNIITPSIYLFLFVLCISCALMNNYNAFIYQQF